MEIADIQDRRPGKYHHQDEWRTNYPGVSQVYS